MTEASQAIDTLARDTVTFRGHPMVRSTHPNTIEVTTEDHLTEKGDCIIGVCATKGCAQLDRGVKEGLRRAGSEVSIRLAAGPFLVEVRASGDPRLELSHPNDIVIRRSDFASARTLAINADKASRDIPRSMVRLLRDPATVGTLTIEVA